MNHTTEYIKIDGLGVECREQLTGNDYFRYFVKHYEFPFASVDKPAEGDKKPKYYTARTYGSTTRVDGEFKHEEVVRWAINELHGLDPDYHNKIVNGG